MNGESRRAHFQPLQQVSSRRGFTPLTHTSNRRRMNCPEISLLSNKSTKGQDVIRDTAELKIDSPLTDKAVFRDLCSALGLHAEELLRLSSLDTKTTTRTCFRGFKGSHGMWSRHDLPEKPTFSEEGYLFCVDVTRHGMLHRGLSTHDIMQEKSMRETASFPNCGLLYVNHSRVLKDTFLCTVLTDQWVQRIRHGKVLTTSVTLDLKRIIMSSFNYFYFKTVFPFSFKRRTNVTQWLCYYSSISTYRIDWFKDIPGV